MQVLFLVMVKKIAFSCNLGGEFVDQFIGMVEEGIRVLREFLVSFFFLVQLK